MKLVHPLQHQRLLILHHKLKKIFPDSPALLYRALIAQSARWPKQINELNKEECISTLRKIGYGIPDVDRATHNDDYRVTLITPSLLELGDDDAHIFRIPIPEELSRVGEDYDILVEVTLSYAANPRRTRRYIKGYLSTWLNWQCSRIERKRKYLHGAFLKLVQSLKMMEISIALEKPRIVDG